MKLIQDIMNYSELLAAEAFSDLLSAGCFDIAYDTGPTSLEHKNKYQTKPKTDHEMVNSWEKEVLETASEMKLLRYILIEAGASIRAMNPEMDRPVTKSDRSIQKSIRKTINKALAFHPPVSLCSV